MKLFDELVFNGWSVMATSPFDPVVTAFDFGDASDAILAIFGAMAAVIVLIMAIRFIRGGITKS